jgi:G3E family GTPase
VVGECAEHFNCALNLTLQRLPAHAQAVMCFACAAPPKPNNSMQAAPDDNEDSEDSSSDTAEGNSNGTTDAENATGSDISSDSESDSDLPESNEAPKPGKESLEHYTDARRQTLATQTSLLTAGGCLLRSKGFVWLSSADCVVEWSSSGLLLELSKSAPWFATIPEVLCHVASKGGGGITVTTVCCDAGCGSHHACSSAAMQPYGLS